MGGMCSDHTRNQLKAFPSALNFDDTEESEKQVSTLNDKRSRQRTNRSNRNVVSNKSQLSVSPNKAEPILVVKRLSLLGKTQSSKDLLPLVKFKSSPANLGKPILSQPIIREAQNDEDKKSSTSAGPQLPVLEHKGKRNEDVQPSTEPSTSIQLKSTQCYRNTLFEIMNRDKTPTPRSPAILDIPHTFRPNDRRNTYSGPTKTKKRKRKLTFEPDESRRASAETCEKSERMTKQQEASSEELPDLMMQRSLRKRISAISNNDRDTLRLSTRF